MNTVNQCSEKDRRLFCHGIRIPDTVEVENQSFLVSLLPCCAQLALPYWAKITGRIRNNGIEEALFNVVITLVNGNNLPVTEYTDVIALEAGQQGEFEVKLVDFQDEADAYTLTIEETGPV